MENNSQYNLTNTFESGIKDIHKRMSQFNANNWLRAAATTEEKSTQNNSTNHVISKRVSPRFRSPQSAPKVESFISEQLFQGIVLSVHEADRTFWARLIDDTVDSPDEEAEIEFSDVSPDDWSLIIPGALFSWNIGRELRNGQVRRTSEIRFRRFIKPSQNAIARAEEEAAKLTSLIDELRASGLIDTT